MDESEVRVTTGRRPIIDRVVRGDASLGQYQAGIAEFARVAGEVDEPIVCLLDLRNFNPLRVDAKVRKSAAEAWRENSDVLMRVMVAEARVVANPVSAASSPYSTG